MTTFFSRRGAVGAHKPISSARVGHFSLDMRRRLLYCLNETARQLLREGLPLVRDDPSQRPLRSLSGEVVPVAELPLLRAWREKTACEGCFLFTPSEGVCWHVSWSASPLSDANAGFMGVLSTLSLTHPEPDWQQLAGLAHDLRTPLQSLRLLALLLENTPNLRAETHELLERLHSSAGRAMAIGMDLLEWCRGPLLGRRMQRSWFPLGAFLTTLAGEHQIAAENKGITLATALKEAQDQEVLCDMVRLGRLLSNLLTNAIRYTSRGEVRLEAGWRVDSAGQREGLTLSVIDTGGGISAEDQESIFQPYERGKAGKESDSGGSGMGLAIVDQLVEELSLTLDVRSQYGQGSTFELLLPSAILRRAETGSNGDPGPPLALPVTPAP